MARPGRTTRNARADAGAVQRRRRLERRHALSLRRAFEKMAHIVVPARSTSRSLTVDGAVRRLHDRQGVIRDTLLALLTDAALLGAEDGWDDAARMMGVHLDAPRTNAVLAVSWDLIHSAALAWVMGGNSAAGLPDWGDGYGGAGSLTAQIVRTSETQLRLLVGEWIENGEPLAHLTRRIEAVTFSRRRANLIAATEVTRAYAAGNILAWRGSGVITHYRWEVANDERACPLCRPLSGMTAPVGEAFRLPDGRTVGPPPAHPLCRCWLTAVVEAAR